MKRLWKTEIQWLDAMFPNGYPIPGSTLISGPGGSGKPLISLAFSGAWLKAGGRALLFLTSTDRAYTEKVLGLLGYAMSDYKGRFLFVDFKPQATTVDRVSDDQVNANLLDPRAWEQVLNMTDGLDGGDMGTLVIASAINLFFFSPTYGERIHAYLKELLADPGDMTVHMTINSDVFRPKATALEAAAQNLFVTRMEKPMRLFLKPVRISGAEYDDHETLVPLSMATLQEIKAEAERGRRDLIPLLSKV